MRGNENHKWTPRGNILESEGERDIMTNGQFPLPYVPCVFTIFIPVLDISV
jgi:hypothetical protein